jgi:hypothetical protein
MRSMLAFVSENRASVIIVGWGSVGHLAPPLVPGVRFAHLGAVLFFSENVNETEE